MDRHGAHRSRAPPPRFRAPIDGTRDRSADGAPNGMDQAGCDRDGRPALSSTRFEPECGIERWGAAAAQAPGMPDLSWQDQCRVLDRQAFGAGRSELLAMLAALGAAAVADEGYAMARPGSQAAYFGPCVSRRPETAGELLAWFLARHPQEP